MSLQISIEQNYLTEEPDDYMAVVRNVPYRDFNDVIKQMTGPGSILKETECVAVINAFWNTIETNLSQGIGYSCEHINITPAAGGVFDKVDEPFSSIKHWKGVNLTPGTKMRKSVVDMPVSVIQSTVAVPVVREFYDIRTSSSNQTITPGYMADIKGNLLKIMGPQAGVFFIHTGTKAETPATKIHVNESKTLTVVIPENLPSGTYKIEVRTHVRQAKELRTGALNALLTVA